MNKKLLITIGIILAIVGGLLFIVMRRSEMQKNLGRNPNFREFLGLGDKKPGANTSSGGVLSNIFTTPNTDTPATKTTFNPLVSLFTSAPSTVDTGTPSQNSNPWLNQPTATAPTGVPTPPLCSDIDLNIPFTAKEQNDLDALAREFEALSKSLYDDDNVSEEFNTHSAVAAELLNTRDLRQFCEDLAYPRLGQAIAPGFSGTTISRRVPTPFWYDTRYDNKGFLSNRTPQTTDTGVETINPRGTYADYDSVESNFKLNIW